MNSTLPTVTKNLLIINSVVYIIAWLLHAQIIDLNYWGGLHFFMSPDFHLYQLVTYMFLHDLRSITHLFFNMFALWMFGRVMESVWGARKFLIYYMVCGIGAGLCQEAVQYLTDSYSLTVGASGAIFGILLAFGMTFPEERIILFPIPIPIKAKWFVSAYAVIELLLAFSSSSDEVAHIAHLGGMLFGFLLIRYWHTHPGADYNLSNGHRFFDNMRNRFERRRGNASGWNANGSQQPQQPPRTGTREDDRSYNARRQQNQAEVDRILDKIRQSGYDSLTQEEKRRLFNASRDA